MAENLSWNDHYSNYNSSILEGNLRALEYVIFSECADDQNYLLTSWCWNIFSLYSGVGAGGDTGDFIRIPLVVNGNQYWAIVDVVDYEYFQDCTIKTLQQVLDERRCQFKQESLRGFIITNRR